MFDYGDAPAPYPSSFPAGAFHEPIGPQLGALRDGEEDAFVDPDALGDDTDNLADEDGVDFGVFRMGQDNVVTVTVQNVPATGAYIDAWLDYDGDGDWYDFQDQIIFGYYVPADGSYDIPTPAQFGTVGETFARVRISEFGTSSPDGYAPNGEVEDYKVDLRPPAYDYGDAPAPYPSSFPAGAFHEPIGPQLGALRDGEEDAFVDPDALGDDTDNLADEDGVDFGVFRMGQDNVVTVTVQNVPATGAYIDAWLDYDGDGDWYDFQDQIIFGYYVPADGSYDIPTPAQFGTVSETFARVRISEFGTSSPDGYAPNGEVEDYKVDLRPPAYDYGDAPAPYPSSFPAGAFHEPIGPQLGALRDGEEDAFVDPDALGDDTDNLADEDGVDFGVFRMGQDNVVTVTVQNVPATGAYIDAWLDYDGDGDWYDFQDQIIFGYYVPADGSYDIPTPAQFGTVGETFARVRISEFGTSSPDGYAPNGEVEDYKVDLRPPAYDYGDAPAPYPSSFPAGAFHEPIGPQLGALRDGEEDAFVDPDALGDDTDNLADEDGVDFGVFRMGQDNVVTVTVQNVPATGAYIDAWLDYDGDGDWYDFQDQIIFGYYVPADGSYDIPTPAQFGTVGETFARVRISEFGTSSPDGYAPNGEVEDYKVDLRPPAYDYGDAPAPYPSSFPAGAFHEPIGPQLGALRDGEEDAFVDPDALGDDTDNLADEDGVDFGVFRMGQDNVVTVTVQNVPATGAYIDAWLDYDGDGDWYDFQDQIIFGYYVPADGSYDIPTPAQFGTVGETFARVRISEFGTSSPDGYAPNGEVEDYKVDLRPPAYDYGDAPAPYPSSFPAGAFHEPIGPQLGALRDGEEDAFVDPDALGDDTDNLADEDGVDFGVFRMGQDNVVTVTVQNVPATGAYIDAWLDYDGDGDWYDFQDQIIFGYYVPADGSYDIPTPAQFGTVGETFARVRISEFGTFSPDGYAPNGEVEDYRVDLQPPIASLDLDATFLAEPSGVITATVSAGLILQSAKTYTISVDPIESLDRVSAPASVTIDAGQSSATFQLTGIDNNLLDGDLLSSVSIQEQPAGPTTTASFVVVDDDEFGLQLMLDAPSISEHESTNGTLSLDSILTEPIDIAISSSDVGEATVTPATVTIPAGQASVSITLDGVADNLVDGDQAVTIVATPTGYSDASAALLVSDVDTATLALSFDAASISENGGSATGTVSLSTPYFQDLVATLSSSDTSEATVPASVTLLAGESTAVFLVSGEDDSIIDPTQSVTITAVSSLGNASAVIDVTNDEVNHPPSGIPAILGIAEAGQVLTADPKAISDVDGLGVFSYQWLSDGAAISGATGNSYQITGVDEGSRISVSVSYIDGQGTNEGPLVSLATEPVAPAPTWIELEYEDFEGGFGSYTDGGKDARIYTGTRSHQGLRSVNLQDNSGVASSTTLTNGLDLATPEYSKLRVEFWFYANSFESGEDFWLQYNDGTGWETIGVWTRGIEFENGQFYFESLELTDQDVDFTTDARIRFRADASGNGDDVYIDEISIQGFGTPSPNQSPVALDDSVTTHQDVPVSISVLQNDNDPNGDVLTIDGFSQGAIGSVADNGDGTLTYTPASGYLGSDTFTYTISDGRGGQSTATVSVEVVDPSVFVDLAFENFENGFGTYTDGGNDAYIASGSTFAHQGNNALALQDNSGVNSSAELTNSLDLATPGYTELKIEFWFKAISFEAGEDFWLQYYDGSSWQTIRAWTRGVDFENGQFNFASVVVSDQDVDFTANSKIRLMADASGNGDDVYIDEIKISAR